MWHNHSLLSLACATDGLSSTLGKSSKAIRHICELQSQRRREVARELVVLRYNVTNCCVHGLKIRSHKRMQVLTSDNSDPSCEPHFRCFSTATSTNTAVQNNLRRWQCDRGLISTARRRLKVASSLSALKPKRIPKPDWVMHTQLLCWVEGWVTGRLSKEVASNLGLLPACTQWRGSVEAPVSPSWAVKSHPPMQEQQRKETSNSSFQKIYTISIYLYIFTSTHPFAWWHQICSGYFYMQVLDLTGLHPVFAKFI